MNERGRPACATCGASLVAGCLFCGGASPLEAPACLGCGEAFEGAAERKKQRDEQQKQQQMMNLAQQGVRVLGQVVQNPSARGILGGLVSEILKSNKS